MKVSISNSSLQRLDSSDSFFSYDDISENSSYPCSKCGKVYKYKNTRRHHEIYECGKEPALQCPYCSYRCKQAGNLRRHVCLRHTEKVIKLDE